MIYHSKNIEPIDFSYLIENEKSAYFDIKTTGLNKKFHNIYGFSILLNKKDIWTLNTYLTESPKEEYELCLLIKEYFDNLHTLILYNGVQFDLPFIDEKFKVYNILPYSGSRRDMYLELKAIKDLLPFSSYSLTSILKELNIENSILPGKKEIKIYEDFFLNKDPKSNVTLLNNLDDSVLVLPKIDEYLHRMTKQYLSISITSDFLLKKWSIKGDYLFIEGKTTHPDSLNVYHDVGNLTIDYPQKSFFLELPIQNGYIDKDTQCHYIIKNAITENIFPTSVLDMNIPKQILLISLDKKFLFPEVTKIAETMLQFLLHSIKNKP